ncbi:MAG: FAD-dependent oxidoreductase [Methylobacteriaceae bacterium]|nr:FAD-dependent oxidoreductase [Methylobacteriaceae bacterium]
MRIETGEAQTFAEVTLDFDGAPIVARTGETIAAALIAAGLRALRKTPNGEERGIYCGMGVCRECLVEVDGTANLRACMTKVSGPHRVRRQTPVATAIPGEAAPRSGDIPCDTPEIAVIGGGAGGLAAAAAAAEAGARVILIDERPQLGGQFYKQPAGLYGGVGPFEDAQFRDGAALIERTRAAGVQIVEGEVWGAFAPLELSLVTAAGPRHVRPGRLIVATGAYERGLPVPGWTLPGVMTTGAAQTLLRSYRVLAGRRILVAGNGPLNLQVARELARAGAHVVAVAELAPRPSWSRSAALWQMLRADPALLRDGVVYLAGLRRRGVPMLFAHRLGLIEKTGEGLRAQLERWNGVSFSQGPTFLADVVCMGYGFMPSNEVLRALDARQVFDRARGHLVTVRDADCCTSVPGLYGVGDCCGLGGAHAAREEGIIAAVAAVATLGRAVPPRLVEEARAARTRLKRLRLFQKGLWRLFAPSAPAGTAMGRDVLICRCEEVTLGEIEAALADGSPSVGGIKRRTRVGMGRCQGRYCGALVAAMAAERRGGDIDEDAFFAPRPPIKPVRIGDLVGGMKAEP